MDVDEEEENASGSEEEADGTAVEGSSDASSESGMDGDDPRLNFDDEDSDDWTDGDGEDEEDSKPKSKQQKTEPLEGTTLFVRNVPFEATDDDLYQVFKTFGPLRYARIAFDHATGRSRGTGFVCFWKREVAQQVLKEAEKMKVLAGAASGTKTNKHATQSHSILTPDPSSSVAAKLVLMGRTLDVVPALSKGDADNLKEAAEKLKEKRTEHRNLYLLREGVIFEDSPAAKDMPPAALKARLASYDQRRSTLRSNPALYISRTRLSVRNLPRFVTERCLKHLGIHAVKAFNEEVKAGEREGVNKDEVEVDEEMKREGKKKSKHKKSGAVKQAKVSRHRTQLDPMHPQGLGRSDGFGFLEMEKHTDALRVLRWANNRPGVVELLWGWWKEELEETVRRVKENPDALKSKRGKGEEWGGVDGTTVVEVENSNVKLERWEKTLKEMEAEGCRERDRPLLVEFSIENKVVTKRREEKMSKSRVKSKGDPAPRQPDGFG
ncbi:RNA recognition motif-containing protein, partial [Tulasnella sp. UAMH 9824]